MGQTEEEEQEKDGRWQNGVTILYIHSVWRRQTERNGMASGCWDDDDDDDDTPEVYEVFVM